MEKGKIYIFDYIGEYGVSPQDIADIINEYKANGVTEFVVYINSPGGSIFDGLAIYNMLKEEDVEIRIFGLAASMASVIALAGKTIRMAKSSFMMIHNPWTWAAGDADEMQRAQDQLEMLKTTIIGIYKDKSGLSEDDLTQMMDDETWLGADQALEQGFVDEVIDPTEGRSIENKAVGFSRYANLVAMKKQESAKMDKTKLIALLDLKDDATDADIEAAINKMKTAPPPAPVAVTVPIDSGDSDEVADLKDQIAKLEKRLDEQDSAGSKARAKALVEKHKNIIPPASLEVAEKMALASPEDFEDFIKTLPALASGGGISSGDEPGEDPLTAHYRKQDKGNQK